MIFLIYLLSAPPPLIVVYSAYMTKLCLKNFCADLLHCCLFQVETRNWYLGKVKILKLGINYSKGFVVRTLNSSPPIIGYWIQLKLPGFSLLWTWFLYINMLPQRGLLWTSPKFITGKTRKCDIIGERILLNTKLFLELNEILNISWE